uniref:Uncharacterized protein n=1 Tax=Eutreptiella gymnastica TaxID=73025 RepID=A0A7S4FW07_9EUGL
MCLLSFCGRIRVSFCGGATAPSPSQLVSKLRIERPIRHPAPLQYAYVWQEQSPAALQEAPVRRAPDPHTCAFAVVAVCGTTCHAKAIPSSAVRHNTSKPLHSAVKWLSQNAARSPQTPFRSEHAICWTTRQPIFTPFEPFPGVFKRATNEAEPPAARPPARPQYVSLETCASFVEAHTDPPGHASCAPPPPRPRASREATTTKGIRVGCLVCVILRFPRLSEAKGERRICHIILESQNASHVSRSLVACRGACSIVFGTRGFPM